MPTLPHSRTLRAPVVFGLLVLALVPAVLPRIPEAEAAGRKATVVPAPPPAPKPAALPPATPVTLDEVALQAAYQALWQAAIDRVSPDSLQSYVSSGDERVRRQAARALGRIRSAAAVPVLEVMLKDPSFEVRAEAAFALQGHSGTAPIFRRAFFTERDIPVRAALFRGLGHVGSVEDLDLLRDGVANETDEVAAAAAEALGRFGVRQVPKAARADVVGALIARARRSILGFDLGGPSGHPSAPRACSYALARLEPKDLPSALQDDLVDVEKSIGDAQSRAWLVRAASTGVDATHWADLCAHVLANADPGARVALGRALGKRGGRPPEGALARLFDDPDRPVRISALEGSTTLGAEPDLPSLLQPFVLNGDAEEKGYALAALLRTGQLHDPKSYLAPDVDPITQSLLTEALTDQALLLDLAFNAPSREVRSVATATLTSLDIPQSTRLRIIAHPDPILAAGGVTALAEKPFAASETPLLEILAHASERDLVVSCLEALHALYTGKRPVVSRPAKGAAGLVDPLRSSSDVGIREAAVDLGRTLGLATPPTPKPAVLPLLSEVRRIRAARVDTDHGFFVIDLFPDEAPFAVWTFASLADKGFFDGLSFHRVVPDFVVQGGDPRGDGWGGPGFALPDEFDAVPFDTWTVGLASSGPDTAGSQWFYTLSPQPHLDGRYIAIGKVATGREVARNIQRGDVMRKVTIERAPAKLAVGP
jgi:cyclophilin family peptidyl-prolyl cis-trans isomerase/HEAT repeat protein